MSDIGRMDKRVYIQTATSTTTATGGRTRTWATTRERWAKVEDTRGSVYDSASGHYQSNNYLKFTIRDSSMFDDLRADDIRVLYKKRIYRVININRGNHDGFYLTLECNGKEWEAPIA